MRSRAGLVGAALGASACATLLGIPRDAGAQPAPSFRATCGELRGAVKKLDHDGEGLVTIEVVGALTDVQSDGVLVYMQMCSPPDPQVLCVTYSTNGRKNGDRVILAGTYSQHGPDHIMLDPCLHHPPRDDAKAK